jgi:hypothetical protein
MHRYVIAGLIDEGKAALIYPTVVNNFIVERKG